MSSRCASADADHTQFHDMILCKWVLIPFESPTKDKHKKKITILENMQPLSQE